MHRALFHTPGRLALVISLLATSLSPGANRYWIDSIGGSFSSTSNWSFSAGGAGGASVPGSIDIANFTLNSTYEVSFTGAVTNSACDVEHGNVTLDLNGQTYTVTSSGAVDVGNIAGQTARLTLFGGNLAVNSNGDNITLGVLGSGYLTLDAGAHVGSGAFKPDLIIGSSSSGTVTVNDNGRIDAQWVRIASSTGSTGVLTLNDPGSIVVGNTENTIGNFGQGTLRIFGGATYHAAGGSFLAGSGDTSSASITVSGTGSLLDIDPSASIGHAGPATMSVSSGGRVTNASLLRLGVSANVSGSASISGDKSRWDLAQNLIVGTSGIGALTVLNGASVHPLGESQLAQFSGSEGRLTIAGPGAKWISPGSLVAGADGNADFTVEDGGEFQANGVRLGLGAGSIASALVTGPGSTLLTESVLEVAVSGTAVLDVSDGAEVYVGSDLTVNDPAGAGIGTLNLDGAAIYVEDNFTNFGEFSFHDGLLQVGGNFRPSLGVAGFVLDGQTQSDLPTLQILGTGVTVNVSSLTVGEDHRGQLVVGNGRSFSLGVGDIALAAHPGSEGIVTVDSGAQLSTNGTLAVGGTGSNPGGSATLTIRNGTVDAQTLRLFGGGVVNLEGGTLVATLLPTLDGEINWNRGRVEFDDIAASLDEPLAIALLGPDRTLHSGQEISNHQGFQALGVSSPLVIDGGVLSSGADLATSSTLEIRSGTAVGGTTASNTGIVHLHDNLATYGGTTFTGNGGTIRGTGMITADVQNNAGGRIEVTTGDDLLLPGTLSNSGAVDVIGGRFRVAGTADNNGSTGIISARNALLEFGSGLTNFGSVVAAGGVSDILGDVTNELGASIIVSAGATAIFYEDVVNNGSFNVSAAGPLTSTAVFFGNLTGNGVAGAGTVFIEGDARPGFSPGLMNFGGSVSFGPFAKTYVEIGGTTPGTEYDKLVVAGDLSVGGTLEVTFINDYPPSAGDTFDLWDAASKSGGYSSVILPALPAGLFWHTARLEIEGILAISGTPQSYADFSAYYGLTTPALGNEEHDLFSNLMEYALGLHPLQVSSGAPGLPSHTQTATDDVFSFDMPVLSGMDVEIQVLTSADLFVWEVLATRTAGGPWTGTIAPNLSPAGPGMESVTITRPLAGDARRFYRLSASLIP